MLDKSSSAMIEIPEGKLETTILTAITELAIAVLVETLNQFLSCILLHCIVGVVGFIYRDQKFINRGET
jgi:hypothetical protein